MKKKICCLPRYARHQRPMRLLVYATLLLLYLMSYPLSAQAEGACPSIAGVIPLVPEIVEQSSGVINQDFYTATLSVELSPGQVAILSSTPDGTGPTRADDRFWIQASPSDQNWSHDYRNSIRTQIVPFPAQDISHLFVVGKNTLHIRLTDLFGPKYSAQPFYLVLLDACPTPTPTTTVTPLPIPTETQTPDAVIQVVVVTATASEAPTPTETASPTSTHTPLPRATATNPATLTATLTVTAGASNLPPERSPKHFVVLWSRLTALATSPLYLALTVALSILWLCWRFLNRPRLLGLLKVENLDSGSVEVISLQQFGAKASIGPDGQIRIVDEELPAIVGWIVAKREDGITSVFWQSEGAQQPEDQAIEGLRDGSVVQIGHYRFTYENLADVTDDNELLDGGIWNEQEWA